MIPCLAARYFLFLFSASIVYKTAGRMLLLFTCSFFACYFEGDITKLVINTIYNLRMEEFYD